MAFSPCAASCSRTLRRLAATAIDFSSSTVLPRRTFASSLATASDNPQDSSDSSTRSFRIQLSAKRRIASSCASCDEIVPSLFHAPPTGRGGFVAGQRSGGKSCYTAQKKLHTSPAGRLAIISTESSSTPPDQKHESEDAARERYKRDQGQLTFTRTSLFKLTLPLDPPSDPSMPYFSDPATAYEEDESPETVSAHKTKRKQGKLPKHKHRNNGGDEQTDQTKGSKGDEEQNWEAVERKHSRNKDQKELLQLGRSARAPGDDDFDVDAPAGASEELRQQEAPFATAEAASARSTTSSSSSATQASSGSSSSGALPEVHSVLFLLHAAQPLSYIANLIRAESPSARPSMRQKVEEVEAEADQPIRRGGSQEAALRSEAVRERSSEAKQAAAAAVASDSEAQQAQAHSERVWATLGAPPSITFLTRASDGKRWSPATAIGDFLREAARVGSFVIRIGSRDVLIRVPSFEDRTRFLRGRLYATTEAVEEMAGVKQVCDAEAHRVTRRWAYGGVGVLATWWLSVTVLTFATPLGWDRMEPVTYLTGLATVIAGYVFVLHRNRDASYRAVLSETTTRRQQVLYEQHGFDPARYAELIQVARGLRKTIKAVAEEYDLEWEQGETRAGKMTHRALEIIRKEEARKNKGHVASKQAHEDEDEQREEAEKAQEEEDKDDKEQAASDSSANSPKA